MKDKTKKAIRTAGKILFFIYIAFLIYFLFFSAKYGRVAEEGQKFRYNLIPFVEIRRFWLYRKELGRFALFLNVVGNIAAFLPLGYILPMLSRNMRNEILVVIAGFISSFCVESIQLITKVGCFDVDDLLLNTIGCLLGYILFSICDEIRWRMYGKKI